MAFHLQGHGDLPQPDCYQALRVLQDRIPAYLTALRSANYGPRPKSSFYTLKGFGGGRRIKRIVCDMKIIRDSNLNEVLLGYRPFVYRVYFCTVSELSSPNSVVTSNA